jgi:hypothetical protein
MIYDILNFNLTSVMGLLLYWLPLSVCVFWYTVRTWANYQKDMAKRDDNFYRPTDTIGSLIGRALVSIIPVANLLAAIFDIAPGMLSVFFSWIGRVFDQPLVPRRKE